MKSCILGYIIKNLKICVKIVKPTKARYLVQLGLVKRHAHIYVHVSNIMLERNYDDIIC